MPKVNTEEEFAAKWRHPEYGTTCRGPLPPNAVGAEINQISRDAFAAEGFENHLRSWEFANLYWWGVHGFGRQGLDCTHGENGFAAGHGFLLQAFIDDEMEEKEQA